MLTKLKKIKDKKKILKATREKQQITYKRIPVRLSADSSGETLQGRRKWFGIFKLMKGKIATKNTLFSKALIHI